MSNDCPSDHELLAFHVGTLADDRIDAVADHLEACPRCEAAIRRLDGPVDPALAVVRRGGPVVPASISALAVLQSGAAPGRLDEPDPAVPENWPKLPGYEILAPLGRGGMGVVYKARQLRLQRAVALKRLRTVRDRDLARARAEAETLAGLRHPNIVQIYEVFEHDGQVYLALELIEGGSLAETLEGRPLDQWATAGLLEVVARAVDHAHRNGVVHRDLKPANILLQAPDGQATAHSRVARRSTVSAMRLSARVPKVADFGVAKRLAIESGVTLEGDVIGTSSYMSPEQASGRPGAVGPAADIYSLGVILYEMLTGRVPIQGPTTLDTLALIRTEDPVPPRRLQPRLARDLETICLKCLEKQPARRYATAADLAEDLRRFRYDQPIRARPPSALYHFGKFAGRNKALLGGIAGAAAALLVGLAFTLFFALGEARQRRLAEENARAAIAERQSALREVYRGRIATASAALLSHDPVEAARQLAEAPEIFRDWEWRHLRARLDESATVFRRAEGEELSLLPGSDGIRLVSLTHSTVRLKDENGEDIRIYPVRASGLIRAGRTPRDTRLVVFDADHTAILNGEGNELFRLPRLERAVLSPDGTKVAFDGPEGANSDRFALADATTGKPLVTLVGHLGKIHALAFSPDGKRIVTASEDATARVWDAEAGKETAVLRGHTVKVFTAGFRPDNKRIVTTSADGTVRQWDAATGAEVEPPYDRHTSEVYAAAYSPDGQRIASGGSDGTVRLWQAIGRQDVLVRHGHTGAVRRLTFSPDGRRLATQGGDGTVRIWDTQTSLPVLRGHTSYVYPVVYSPDGRWIASGSWDTTVRLWDARTGESRGVWQHPSRVLDVAFMPDSATLVSCCGDDSVVRLWNVATGSVTKELTGPEPAITNVAVSPGGERIVAVNDKGIAYVLDATTGERVASFTRWGGKLAFSPDGSRLAVAVAGGNVQLVDTKTFRPCVELIGHTQMVISVGFSRDGRRLVTGGHDSTVRIWDADSGKCQAVCVGHPDKVFAVAFHPDGTRVASAGTDGAVWLWDVETGTEVARLRGHTNYIWSLAFSPDGKTLVSGSGDSTVRLWDTEPVAERYRAMRQADAPPGKSVPSTKPLSR